MTANDLLVALQTAWNAADSAAWAANFADDTYFVDALGGTHRGSATLRLEHQQLWDTVFQGSTLELSLADVRSLGDGLQVVHTAYVLRVPSGPRAGEFRGTQIMVVRDGKILDFQNTYARREEAFAGIAGHQAG